MTSPIPPLSPLIERITMLLEKATPGPWEVRQVRGYCIDEIFTTHPDYQPSGASDQHKAHILELPELDDTPDYIGTAGLAAGHPSQQFEQNAALIVEMRNTLPALITLLGEVEEALEWALDEAGNEHPHYPYRTADGRWAYPYLVSGTPLGGGVGEATFETALDAVKDARARTVIEKMGKEVGRPASTGGQPAAAASAVEPEDGLQQSRHQAQDDPIITEIVRKLADGETESQQ